MNVVTVSPKFQIVIPSKVCKSLDIKPGEKYKYSYMKTELN